MKYYKVSERELKELYLIGYKDKEYDNCAPSPAVDNFLKNKTPIEEPSKDNKQAIVIELNKLHMKYAIDGKLDMQGMYEDHLWDFASNLLSKLSPLNRSEVEKILEHSMRMWKGIGAIGKHGKLDVRKVADQILSLIPAPDKQDTEVIQGKVKLTGIGYVIKIKNDRWATAESMFKKYKDKEIIAAIEEVNNG